MIDLTWGTNPLGPSSKAKHAIRKEARRANLSAHSSLMRLQRYICGKEGIGPENICFGNGSTHILNTLIRTVAPGTIIMAEPISRRYREMLTKYQVDVRSHGLSSEGPPSTAADEFAAHLQIADLAVIPNPHDTTGKVIQPEDIRRIIVAAEELSKVLVIDEGYREYTPLSSPVEQVAASRGALIVRTFSLYHGLAGLRMAYAIGSTSLLNRMADSLDPCHISSVASCAALSSLKDKGYRKRTTAFLNQEKGYLREHLSKIPGLEYHEGPGSISCVNLGKLHVDAEKEFLKKGILVEQYADQAGNTWLKLPVARRKFAALFLRVLREIMEC